MIATFDLKDFPAGVLGPRRVVALHPDALVGGLLDADADVVEGALAALVASFRTPSWTAAQVLAMLTRAGLENSAARIGSRLRRG